MTSFFSLTAALQALNEETNPVLSAITCGLQTKAQSKLPQRTNTLRRRIYTLNGKNSLQDPNIPHSEREARIEQVKRAIMD